MSLRYHSLVAV